MDSSTASKRTSFNEDEDQENNLLRSNSVRDRAHLFQQKLQNPAPPKPSSQKIFAPEKVSSDKPTTSVKSKELSDDIEPSSLSLAERLKFFNRMSSQQENFSAKRSFSLHKSSSRRLFKTCSLNDNQPYELNSTTDSSSISIGDSMASPLIQTDSSSYLNSSSASTISRASVYESCVEDMDLNCSFKSTIRQDNGFKEEVEEEHVLKPSVLRQLAKAKITNTAELLLRSATLNGSTDSNHVTPINKRIKLKTIGKIFMPTPFTCADYNNNCKHYQNNHTSSDIDITTASTDDIDHTGPANVIMRKIGKIKSPFIDNCAATSVNGNFKFHCNDDHNIVLRAKDDNNSKSNNKRPATYHAASNMHDKYEQQAKRNTSFNVTSDDSSSPDGGTPTLVHAINSPLIKSHEVKNVVLEKYGKYFGKMDEKEKKKVATISNFNMLVDYNPEDQYADDNDEDMEGAAGTSKKYKSINDIEEIELDEEDLRYAEKEFGEMYRKLLSC